ncbi:MAG: putative lactoylglutathione lyase [Halieaceae bacterium]|jgi:predicted lactoylglutathione lyase
MIGYVTIGTNDLQRAASFYDALLAEVGGKRMMEEDSFVAWISEGAPGASLAVTQPFDGESATVGNGVMVAIAVGSRDEVTRFYNKAIELGGTDEGAPGPRGEGFFAGYFRDLDGNKLNVFVAG